MNVTYWIALLLFYVDYCSGLVCWYCIDNSCHGNPEDNHRAEQRKCMEGQICQKTVYAQKSDIDDSKFQSTVRSCSEECIPQNDFLNCTHDLYSTRGCINRACCSDGDLCNGAEPRLLVRQLYFFNVPIIFILKILINS